MCQPADHRRRGERIPGPPLRRIQRDLSEPLELEEQHLAILVTRRDPLEHGLRDAAPAPHDRDRGERGELRIAQPQRTREHGPDGSPGT
jgi:hypothetical protein